MCSHGFFYSSNGDINIYNTGEDNPNLNLNRSRSSTTSQGARYVVINEVMGNNYSMDIVSVDQIPRVLGNSQINGIVRVPEAESQSDFDRSNNISGPFPIVTYSEVLQSTRRSRSTRQHRSHPYRRNARRSQGIEYVANERPQYEQIRAVPEEDVEENQMELGNVIEPSSSIYQPMD
ncbi:uncharacterized protein LOC119680312 isoform X2 [Teleopsis dalmanni]|uniref:uncharacterized protein LOC119680312 isoform X1 n=1 Tax=Teleopsis dalmanni TaxID=139649 RepID=UPI0018CF9A88|nr:uncharacterized protein LOC119680312 isoform X1 [Teleopsis dalmanni]XP_037949001.1 uncharacterized protein LOC119680312 isoform X1 [Teleopsis dalmanni]XP_037949002.1 uncharacterized protein LOC119680312 isoform X2 [Teleopsis dalmanni]